MATSSSSPQRPQLHLRELNNQGTPINRNSDDDIAPEDGHFDPFVRLVALKTAWARRNWTWAKCKPVIRCASVAWILVVLFVIPGVQDYLGQTAYFVLIAPYLSPPSGPFVSVLEQQLLLLFFLTVAWGWASLGIFVSSLVRHVVSVEISSPDIPTGKYIEPLPTIVIALFIFFGSGFFLFIKAREGFQVFPYVFAALSCMDISLTTALLTPYPTYDLGRKIVVAFALNSLASLIGSLVIFPVTISSQFADCLQKTLTPSNLILENNRRLLNSSIDSGAFSQTAADIHVFVQQCEASLIPMTASARLLKSDLTYSRVSPDDLQPFLPLVRRLMSSLHGLGNYPNLIDPSHIRPDLTPATSRPPSPDTPTFGKGSWRHRSSNRSRESSPDHAQGSHSHGSPPTHPYTAPPTPRLKKGQTSPKRQSLVRTGSGQHIKHHDHPHILHHSLLSLAKSRAKQRERVVGLFVSQRYLDLEVARLTDPSAPEYIRKATDLLQKSCDDVLDGCVKGLAGVGEWFTTMRKNRFSWWVHRGSEPRLAERLKVIKTLRGDISSTLDEFRIRKRHLVLEPYRAAFEEPTSEDEEDDRVPPHRYLFNCYVYQYHLIQICSLVLEMLDRIIAIEETRPRHRVWTPVYRLLRWDSWFSIGVGAAEDIDTDDDPNVIQGLGSGDLGTHEIHRDPDALPPRNIFEWLMSLVHTFFTSLVRGNLLFALKAGLFAVILSLPSFLKVSAPMAYRNKSVWAIFMGQMTLARFRGDTGFELVVRIVSTFFGGLVGLALWYIANGSGRSAVGTAAVSAVCLPSFLFVRLYCPIPPIPSIIFFLTAFLVVGYSYQDDSMVLEPGHPGVGWAVAWRRFLLVTIGVVAAFLVSYFPPSTTLRRYERNLLATTSSEIGTLYCSIISYINTKREPDVQVISTSLAAVQSKLKRALKLKSNTIYEFSAKGRWPAHRYERIIDLQLDLSRALSALLSVIENLEPAWAQALLRKTRLTDPDFHGDILAVISLISLSLRTGSPLPEITPCPLLDRFMERYKGIQVRQKSSESDHGLPLPLCIETLHHEQYLMFCVGISTAFGIISRLDRLMLATKELVGEQYQTLGVGFISKAKSGGVELGPRTNSVHFNLPRDV